MSKHTISFTLNGDSVTQEVDSRLLLVHLLRDDLQKTGTHIGCDTSNCGACTVLLDSRSVKSCTVFAAQANGKAVETIEGMEQDALHPLQEGFHEEHGLQCGFCTPGFVASMAVAHLNGATDHDTALAGNLCRCTGYVNIIKAIQYAANKLNEQQKEAA